MSGAMVEVAEVTAPDELQSAVESGSPHIFIRDHMDLTGLGPAANSSEALERLVAKTTTKSIRVRRTTT
jgi:hypothetical protein